MTVHDAALSFSNVALLPDMLQRLNSFLFERVTVAGPFLRLAALFLLPRFALSQSGSDCMKRELAAVLRDKAFP